MNTVVKEDSISLNGARVLVLGRSEAVLEAVLGELTALNVGKNCCLFDPRADLHRHFCCQKCGNVIDMM